MKTRRTSAAVLSQLAPVCVRRHNAKATPSHPVVVENESKVHTYNVLRNYFPNESDGVQRGPLPLASSLGPFKATASRPSPRHLFLRLYASAATCCRESERPRETPIGIVWSLSLSLCRQLAKRSERAKRARRGTI